MPTLHINVAHISISQAYYFIAIYYQSDHSIPLLYKTLFLRNIISTSVSRHTDNTQALHFCHNTACFVTARLAVQLNGIVQNHSTCRFVVTTQLHFPKPSTIILVVATVFSKTVAHNSYRLIYTSVFSEWWIYSKAAPNRKIISGVVNHNACLSQRYFQKLSPTIHTACFAHLYLASRKAMFTFTWCFFKKNCFVTPSFIILWVLHISIMFAMPLK